MNLGHEQYVSVTTYRRNGAAVPTPVWVAQDADAIVIWTVADSGKVKRMRANPSVTVAPCDVRGRPLGEPVSGRAEILSAEETERVRRLLRAKYGLQGRLVLLASLVRRGRSGTVGVRITDI
ncbi:PPOX class F420-dependent oxidoreductase [Nonomuraea sp. NPDC059194]|uniref:PPOX class F420-dependent oxidoreductase n=1 Tax=Nonomuraea sp. NPDC059194 TaxID=3346764 RepID=UPI00369976E3